MGSGPNGLVAALVLQRAGLSVTLHERLAVCGGGLITEALAGPNYLQDACAAVLPLATASPALSALGIAVPWVMPEYALAHPFDDGTAALLHRELPVTCASLDAADRVAYRRLFDPLLAAWAELLEHVLAPLHLPHGPRGSARFARFARRAMLPAARLVRRFSGERAAALLAGVAAHGTLPLERAPSAAFALVLAGAAHGQGWPLLRGGSQRLADALASALLEAGGRVLLRSEVTSLAALGDAPALLDTSPAALLRLAGPRLSRARRKRLRQHRYGPGVHRVDWVLSEPIPWRARECAAAGTVHLGGCFEEIAAALRSVNAGQMPERPFVLLGQPTQFDATRAPAGNHLAWAYCCVPFGSGEDVTAAIEAQVERFAPGFRDCVRSRQVRTARALEAHNPNLVGGSIAGSVHSLTSFFLGPLHGVSPYRVERGRLYLCSAATPPGPGAHGMCGWHAAHALLRDLHIRE